MDFLRFYRASSNASRAGWIRVGWKTQETVRGTCTIFQIFFKQEVIRNLYSGRICGSEGTNWRPRSVQQNRCWVLFIVNITWIESYGHLDFGKSWYHNKLKILARWNAGLTWVPRQSHQKRNKSICDLAWVPEKSRMMVTIKIRRIINAYLGRSTKPVQRACLHGGGTP